MRAHRSRSYYVVFLAAFCTLSSTSRVPAQTLPDGFLWEQAIAPPFGSQPIGFDFMPDGRVVIIEKPGGVRIAPVGGSASVLVHTIPDVDQSVERGLLGTATDPDWPTRPYIYFYYSHIGGTNRVVMYTVSGDLGDPSSTNLTLSSPFDLLRIPDSNASHNGGTVRFGSDGMLYASCGDDVVPRCDAQDLTSLLGKITRLDVSAMPGVGTGPPPKADITPSDNPFPGPDENEQLVYVWGLRNPYRFTFDPLTGDMYIGDVGGVNFEEVDHVPAPSLGGQNFGWPLREGFGVPKFPDTCGQSNTLTDPIYDYPHDPPNPASIIGGPLMRAVPGSPTSFPTSYDGDYFFLDHNGQFLRRLVNNGSAWVVAPPVPGQPAPDRWAEGFPSMTDLQMGPDGGLYMMRFSGGLDRGLWRIAPDPAVTAVPIEPVARAFSIAAAPNPARVSNGSELRWDLPRSESARLEVYDVAGRSVRTLVNGTLPAGPGSARWDARTNAGNLVPAGAYVFSLETESGHRATGKLLLLR